MTKTLVGALLGAVLAFAGLEYGFGGFILVTLLMAAGGAIGYFAQSSDTGISSLLDSVRKSSSSR